MSKSVRDASQIPPDAVANATEVAAAPAPRATASATTTQGTAARGAADRIPWIDMARGACVLAVVLFHICLFHFLPITQDATAAARGWTRVNSALSVLRMPLLLLVSGWLAATKISQGFKPRTRLSIATNYWLYLVWLTVLAVLCLITGANVATSMHSPGDYLRQLVAPMDSGLWFVFALALYVTVLTAARKVPSWIVLAALVVLSCVMSGNHGWDGEMWRRVLMLWVFFAIGVYLKPILMAAANSTRDTGIAFVIALVAAVGRLKSPHPIDQLFFIIMGIAVAITLLGITRHLAKVDAVRRPMQWVGRRTLGIYVIHIPFVALVAMGLERWQDGFGRFVLSSPVVTVLYPLVALGVVVGACVLIENLLRAVGLRDMFALPGWLSRRIGGTSA